MILPISTLLLRRLQRIKTTEPPQQIRPQTCCTNTHFLQALTDHPADDNQQNFRPAIFTHQIPPQITILQNEIANSHLPHAAIAPVHTLKSFTYQIRLYYTKNVGLSSFARLEQHNAQPFPNTSIRNERVDVQSLAETATIRGNLVFFIIFA